jgi:hypothetical protein
VDQSALMMEIQLQARLFGLLVQEAALWFAALWRLLIGVVLPVVVVLVIA